MPGFPNSAQWLLLITLVLTPGLTTGSEPEPQAIVLNAESSGFLVGRKMLILEDKTNALSFSEILERKMRFRPVDQDILNVGPTRSTYWIYFRVENRTSREWFLHVGTPFMKEAELFQQTKTGHYKKAFESSARPFSERNIKTNQLIFPLRLNAGDTAACYLRVRSNSIIRVPLEIASMQHIYEQNQVADVVSGFYFGLIAALIIYNLFVFISIRERTYLYYVVYVLFVAFNIGYIKGYFLQFIVPNFPAANHSNFSGAIAFTFAILFTDSFLNTRYYCPKLRRLGWLIYASCAFTFIVSLAGELLLGFYVNWITVFSFLVYSNVIGFTVMAKGFVPAKYYLMGFSILVAGIIIFMFKDIALIEENWFTDGAYQIGSGLEAIILSFALANKLNTFKKEKELTQAHALAQATQFSQQLIGSQEGERKRVAAELHDSLGQSLGMVKNKVLMIKRDVDKPQIREKQINDLEVLVTETIQEVRNISYNLRPLHLELLGITQSIRSLLEDIAESGLIVVKTDIQLIDDLLSKPNEINVFRIVQECFNNIIKHSHATRAEITIRTDGTFIAIRIADNGVGMTLKTEGKTGFGLLGIRERLNILNGNLEILENEPRGTIMNIQIRL
ncbi:7TM diverse intracellular signaling domain-containing protein [Dyadobacter sp. CY323]|uniref:sensor histidine kinase n=1 Tax=Dyadobacter sp. CY323 TaxID=2907302 RepID=UPI001F255C64|nr:7TM diverse intracellular signaling domain-containing protein [Dyadobacter sp. CY323]MCE6991942.1 histidine kinase [Dyadobacter sp. CY323]